MRGEASQKTDLGLPLVFLLRASVQNTLVVLLWRSCWVQPHGRLGACGTTSQPPPTNTACLLSLLRHLSPSLKPNSLSSPVSSSLYIPLCRTLPIHKRLSSFLANLSYRHSSRRCPIMSSVMETPAPRRYEIDELLLLSKSPLVCKPEGLPPIEEWMG